MSITEVTRIIKANNNNVVGIDLSGYESKPSGWALINSTNVTTKTIFSDDDLIKETRNANPVVISIDAPISLPSNVCIDDDNLSNWHENFIIRSSEKSLMRYGVRVYPCLLPSMVALTKRCIRLVKVFLELGYKVIECHPSSFFNQCGITINYKTFNSYITFMNNVFSFEHENIGLGIIDSMISIDSIISAIVGVFYLENQYVNIGCQDEGFITIPRVFHPTKRNQVIIGLCGETATGKTTIADYISYKYGYALLRYSQILSKLSTTGTSKIELQKLGLSISQNTDAQRTLSHEMINIMKPFNNYVIDGLRQIEDYEEFAKHFKGDFILIYINSEQSERYRRYIIRERKNIDWQEFLSIDNHPCERNISTVAKHANYIIYNRKGYRYVFSQIDKIFNLL